MAEMKDYNITSYGVFDSGVTSTKNYGSQVDTVKTDVVGAKTTLSDSGVLMGPFQDECLRVLTTINTDFTTISDSLTTMSNHLITTSGNYQTGDTNASNTVSTTEDKVETPSVANSDIAAKKQKFVGNVDDPNSYDEVKPNFKTMRKTMTLFDNTTGEELKDNDTITMKPGETRIITVKLPTDTGMIQEIHRTTADGNDVYRSGNVVHAVSDVDPDPNKIDYVNYKDWSRHIPSDKSILHSNTYDWVITAKADGSVTASQTCEYTTDVSKGGNLKAMIDLNVVVSSDDTTA